MPDARTNIKINGITEAHFNTAMNAVLNESVRRRTHATDISTEVSTQGADINVRNNTENRNTTNDSENSLNLNNYAPNDDELPDIDQTISDESYPSNSAFSFNHESENYDKTPDFEPEWDPG